jgi:hypothetical protein
MHLFYGITLKYLLRDIFDSMIESKFTIYLVPGPSNVRGIMRDGIAGGWDYALKAVEFIQLLNPNTQFDIVFGHLVDFGDVPTLPKFENVNYFIYTAEKNDLNLLFPNQPSSQHGALLNFSLKHHNLNTKFYAVLDPDCYVILPNAFKLLQQNMVQNELAIIGVSYPVNLPKTYYWDFPTAYFQLMNSELCPTHKLNFIPDEKSFIINAQHPGDASLPIPKISKLVALMPNFLKKIILRILSRFFRSSRLVSLFISGFYLNFPHRNLELSRDTGWFNRDYMQNLKTEILPHLIKEVNLHFSFNVLEYEKYNSDLEFSNVNRFWHFLVHGVFENRAIGKQPISVLFLKKLFTGVNVSPQVHPASSITMGIPFLMLLQAPINWGNMLNSFEYRWREKPFCIHLGHSGKSTKYEDMFKLNAVRDFVLESMEK